MPSPIVDPILDFMPDPQAPCVCGSKRKFIGCCGAAASNERLPKKVMLKRGFLSPSLCDKLVNYALRQDASDLETYADAPVMSESGLQLQVNADRISRRVDLGDKQASVDSLVAKIMEDMLAPALKLRVREYTRPDLMRYDVGGYYKAHADSELFDARSGKWKKVLDRDYSLLLYLNDDYKGGGLKFVRFSASYQPVKGDLLLFPSDNMYLHEAEPVTEGTKLVIVSWAATGKKSNLTQH